MKGLKGSCNLAEYRSILLIQNVISPFYTLKGSEFYKITIQIRISQSFSSQTLLFVLLIFFRQTATRERGCVRGLLAYYTRAADTLNTVKKLFESNVRVEVEGP